MYLKLRDRYAVMYSSLQSTSFSFLLKDNKYTWNEDPDVDEKIVMIVIPPSACKDKMRGSGASRLHSNSSRKAVCRSYSMFVSQEVK